jgi:hypothetical protein
MNVLLAILLSGYDELKVCCRMKLVIRVDKMKIVVMVFRNALAEKKFFNLKLNFLRSRNIIFGMAENDQDLEGRPVSRR